MKRSIGKYCSSMIGSNYPRQNERRTPVRHRRNAPLPHECWRALRHSGADGETRTPTAYATAPSRQRVYQFHHVGLSARCTVGSHPADQELLVLADRGTSLKRRCSRGARNQFQKLSTRPWHVCPLGVVIISKFCSGGPRSASAIARSLIYDRRSSGFGDRRQ